MKIVGLRRTLLASALVAGLGLPGRIAAQLPAEPVTPAPAPPPTIWNFLGIPKTTNKLRDMRVNRQGNRPQAERVDALKRIADPSNLQSPSAAVRAAAKIKQDQDEVPQKVKAIKYLATVGCGCYPGVKEALVESLSDCSEEVRYEAAIALCQAAGNPCNRCQNGGCCNATVMNKLNDMAYGTDDKGCPKESSPQVRAAAMSALAACQRMHPAGPQGPTPAIKPVPEKTDIEPPIPIKPRPIDKPAGVNETPLPIVPRSDAKLLKDMPAPPADTAPAAPLPPSEKPADQSSMRKVAPKGDLRISLDVRPTGYQGTPQAGQPAKPAASTSNNGILRISLIVPERHTSKTQPVEP